MGRVVLYALVVVVVVGLVGVQYVTFQPNLRQTYIGLMLELQTIMTMMTGIMACAAIIKKDGFLGLSSGCMFFLIACMTALTYLYHGPHPVV